MEDLAVKFLELGSTGLVGFLFIYFVNEFKKLFIIVIDLTKTTQSSIDKNTESFNKLSEIQEKNLELLGKIDNTTKFVFEQFLNSAKK